MGFIQLCSISFFLIIITQHLNNQIEAKSARFIHKRASINNNKLPHLLENNHLRQKYISNISNSLVINNSGDKLNIDNFNSIILKRRYANYIEILNQSQLFKPETNQSHTINSLIELIFPVSNYGNREQLESAIESGDIRRDKFQLEVLNITFSCLTNSFLDNFSAKPSLFYSTLFHRILIEYFSRLRVIKLSSNKFSRLNRKNFELFAGSIDMPSKLEILMLDSNELVEIRHDSFYDLKELKSIDLSNNKLKIIHPLTFAGLFNLFLINMANNNLKAVFNPPLTNNKTNYPLSNLKYLYLQNNNDLKCDSGLEWLYNRKNEINLDDFECKYENSTTRIEFKSIESETCLKNQSSMPDLQVDTKKLEETSSIPLFNLLSKRWFAWNVFTDILPVTTPYPYLMSADRDNDTSVNDEGKHVFHSWYMSDLVLKCSSDSKSTIIWKTQYGYLSYLDEEILLSNNDYNSYKIFYKMNALTKLSKNFTVVIGQRFGSQSISQFYVNSNNELTVTNMRQAVSGSFVCIALNENDMKTYEYDLRVRTGMGENFINSLFASLIFSVITLIIGIISCCILEHQAKKKFPETPPYYPTPMANTPPNFDFNEWMSNAASYLPNINIHDTLEQVSKKLRKGMEKASVTVKSLGLTSTAYIYSVYEHSTQRWSDIKSYVPTLNVPTITLPTMRYTPVSQLANRMRTGVGNMFIPMGKFCGTSDLSHTVSINDLQSDMNASNTIGKILILDQIDLKETPQNIQHYQGYYKFLNFLKEESKRNKQKNNLNIESKRSAEHESNQQSVAQIILLETPTSSSSGSALSSMAPNDGVELENNQPMTSAAASASTSLNSKPKLNLIVAFINPNSKSLKIENIDEEENDDDDEI